MKMEHFITDYFFQLLAEQEAKFIFEQAEKMLKNTLDTSTLIIARATTLTTITTTLLITLFGFAINRFDSNKTDTLFITSVAGVIYLFIITVMLFLNTRPNFY